MDNNNIKISGAFVNQTNLTLNFEDVNSAYFLYVNFIRQEEPVKPSHTDSVFIRYAVDGGWGTHYKENPKIAGVCVECVGTFKKFQVENDQLKIFGVYPTLRDCRYRTNPIVEGSEGVGSDTGGGSSSGLFTQVFLTENPSNRNEIIEWAWLVNDKFNPLGKKVDLETLINSFPPVGMLSCAGDWVLLGYDSNNPIIIDDEGNTAPMTYLAKGFSQINVPVDAPVGALVYFDMITGQRLYVTEQYPHIRFGWDTEFAGYNVSYMAGGIMGFGPSVSFNSYRINGLTSQVSQVVASLKSNVSGLSEVNVDCPGNLTGLGLEYNDPINNGGDNEPGERIIHVPLSRYKAEIWLGSLNPNKKSIKIHETTADELLAFVYMSFNASYSYGLTNANFYSPYVTNCVNHIDLLLANSMYDFVFDNSYNEDDSPNDEEYYQLDANVMDNCINNTQHTPGTNVLSNLQIGLDLAIHSFGGIDELYVIIREGVTLIPGYENVDYVPLRSRPVDYQILNYRDYFKVDSNTIIKVSNFDTIEKIETFNFPANFLEQAQTQDPYFYRGLYKNYFFVYSYFSNYSSLDQQSIAPYVFVEFPSESRKLEAINPFYYQDFRMLNSDYNFITFSQSGLPKFGRLYVHWQDDPILFDNGGVFNDIRIPYLPKLYNKSMHRFMIPTGKKNTYLTPHGFALPKQTWPTYLWYAMHTDPMYITGVYDKRTTDFYVYPTQTIKEHFDISLNLPSESLVSSHRLERRTLAYPSIHREFKNKLPDTLMSAIYARKPLQMALESNYSTKPGLFDVSPEKPYYPNAAPILESYWVFTIDTFNREFDSNYIRRLNPTIDTTSHVDYDARSFFNHFWFLIINDFPVYMIYSLDEYEVGDSADWSVFVNSYPGYDTIENLPSTHEYNPFYKQKKVKATKIIKFSNPHPKEAGRLEYNRSYFVGFFGKRY